MTEESKQNSPTRKRIMIEEDIEAVSEHSGPQRKISDIL
jgi:hypothetical protein